MDAVAMREVLKKQYEYGLSLIQKQGTESSLVVDIKEGYIKNAKGDFLAMIREALNEYVESILNSENFKEKVLKQKFFETGGRSNSELYEYIMSKKKLVYNLILHVEANGPYGYTYLNSDKIWLNAWYYDWDLDGKVDWDALKINSLCNTLVHEATHNMFGFVHSDRSNWSRSVPYAIGNIVDEIAFEMTNNSLELTPVSGQQLSFKLV